MIYLVVFALTVALVYLGESCRGSLRFVLVASGLLLPCLLAGARSPEIGTDIYSYAIGMYQSALLLDLPTFLNVQASIAAFGWNIATWAASNAGGSFEFYLFVIELLCILPIYFGLKRLASGFEWVGILVWLLLFYAFSLNIMRQSIAMGFVFLSFSFLKDRSPLKFSICILIAFLFHQTAILGFALYPLARLAANRHAGRSFFGRWQGLAIVLLILSVFSMVFAFADELVVALSFLKDSYSYQVQHLGGKDISIASLYLLAGCSIVWLISKDDFSSYENKALDLPIESTVCAAKKPVETRNDEFYLAAMFSCAGGLVWQLNYVSDSLGRLGSYGTVFICAMAVSLMTNGKRSRGHVVVLIAMCIVYFVVMIMFLGKEEVFPYSSTLLGI